MIKAIDIFVNFFRTHEREPDLQEFRNLGYGQNTYYVARRNFRKNYYDEWQEILKETNEKYKDK